MARPGIAAGACAQRLRPAPGGVRPARAAGIAAALARSGDHDRAVRLLGPARPDRERDYASLFAWCARVEVLSLVGRLEELDEAVDRLQMMQDLMPRGQRFSAGVAAWEPGTEPGAVVLATVDDAGDLLVGTAGVLIRVLALALPLGLLALAAWLGTNAFRRRRRESALV